MTRKEFDAVVDDAVKNGADRKDVEAYVVAGYKLEGIPKADKAANESAKPAKQKA